MEARITSAFLLAACIFSMGAGYRTENFIVSAPNRKFAKQVGEYAEKYRKELAMDWLGYELDRWRTPCPIRVLFKPNAEGVTQFSIFYARSGKGTPDHWNMTVAGTPQRILDAVLPHEVTHTIFATHFGRKLPRWADEGACTAVEHISERQKNHKMLVHFLTNGKGIAFNKMFRMKEYPRDMLPLYAQGYSLTRYFLEQKGRKHFIKYLGEGMQTEDWDTVTKKYYGFADLSDLQLSWIDWLKQGCPDPNTLLAARRKETLEAENDSRPSAIARADLQRSNHRQQVSRNGASANQENLRLAQATQSTSGSFYVDKLLESGASIGDVERNSYKAKNSQKFASRPLRQSIQFRNNQRFNSGPSNLRNSMIRPSAPDRRYPNSNAVFSSTNSREVIRIPAPAIIQNGGLCRTPM